MNTEDSTDIGSFASVVNRRLAADAYIARAKAFGWLCGALGIAFVLAASGVAVAFWGYSHMVS